MVERLALSPEETAEALGLGRSTVYKLIRSGVIPTVRLGGGHGRLLISVAALAELLAADRLPQPRERRRDWLAREHERAFGEKPTRVQT